MDKPAPSVFWAGGVVVVEHPGITGVKGELSELMLALQGSVSPACVMADSFKPSALRSLPWSSDPLPTCTAETLLTKSTLCSLTSPSEAGPACCHSRLVGSVRGMVN